MDVHRLRRLGAHDRGNEERPRERAVGHLSVGGGLRVFRLHHARVRDPRHQGPWRHGSGGESVHLHLRTGARQHVRTRRAVDRDAGHVVLRALVRHFHFAHDFRLRA